MKKKKTFKLNKKTKTILLIIMILLLTSALLIHLFKPTKTSYLRGNGLECFNQCSNICTQRESKVLSFTATETKCGCTCTDNGQVIYNIN